MSNKSTFSFAGAFISMILSTSFCSLLVSCLLINLICTGRKSFLKEEEIIHLQYSYRQTALLAFFRLFWGSNFGSQKLLLYILNCILNKIIKRIAKTVQSHIFFCPCKEANSEVEGCGSQQSEK